MVYSRQYHIGTTLQYIVYCKFYAINRGSRGFVTVMAHDCPERGESGATTTTLPNGATCFAKNSIPLASIPSSFVISINGFIFILIRNEELEIRNECLIRNFCFNYLIRSYIGVCSHRTFNAIHVGTKFGGKVRFATHLICTRFGG